MARGGAGERRPSPHRVHPTQQLLGAAPWPVFTDAGEGLAVERSSRLPTWGSPPSTCVAGRARLATPVRARRRPCAPSAPEFPRPPSHAAASRSSLLVSCATAFARRSPLIWLRSREGEEMRKASLEWNGEGGHPIHQMLDP
ncbi:hypothetical protein PVAP13_5NG012309 [Panicum virgatum]|uniref:Uncharacterized protein n=1 Tax=Panicum virgatum TaxID=38727 RepID=A0A8T0S8R9_PANVG|nr:hypothetical protein PVAP13_5NG012309 [Panicum virgatum]